MYSNLDKNPAMTLDKRMKILYPMVREEDTPLPKCWSIWDKDSHIGLSHHNLRIHSMSHGSVRAVHPIPAACGLYYFEIKICSKGSNGYTAVGLSPTGVNLNSMPGMAKHSYGYHGDDGKTFCGSANGQVYGPTFTSGDVVGCGINLVGGTCFFTKNGHHLGVAFRNLSGQLYPTVGLQSRDQVVDSNFGQEPFLFDIEGEMKDLRRKTEETIGNLRWLKEMGDMQTVLCKMVSAYLVHQGYSQTAQVFASTTGSEISEEELTSMKKRQHIQKLVLTGKIGEAITTVDKLYPGLLQLNQDLHLKLKVRQFIEMVSGADSLDSGSSPDTDQETIVNGNANSEVGNVNYEDQENNDSNRSCTCNTDQKSNDIVNSGNIANGTTESEASNSNVNCDDIVLTTNSMHTDQSKSIVNNPSRYEDLVKFGRALQMMATEMEEKRGKSEANFKMMTDAFSLLAYEDPWSSPVGWQLDHAGREPVCVALNSAMLEFKNAPGRSSLEISLAHSKQLLRLMATSGLGACAFADIDALLN